MVSPDIIVYHCMEMRISMVYGNIFYPRTHIILSMVILIAKDPEFQSFFKFVTSFFTSGESSRVLCTSTNSFRDIDSAGVTDLSHVHKMDVTSFVLLRFLSILHMYIISMLAPLAFGYML